MRFFWSKNSFQSIWWINFTARYIFLWGWAIHLKNFFDLKSNFHKFKPNRNRRTDHIHCFSKAIKIIEARNLEILNSILNFFFLYSFEFLIFNDLLFVALALWEELLWHKHYKFINIHNPWHRMVWFGCSSSCINWKLLSRLSSHLVCRRWGQQREKVKWELVKNKLLGLWKLESK